MTADQGPNASGTPDGVTHETVFTIPIGDDGVQYRRFVNLADTQTDASSPATDIPADPGSRLWGPTALTVDRNGTFFIADTVGGRILHYDAGGALVTPITLADQVVAAGDVKVTDQDMWVLDDASEVPQLLRFASTAPNDATADTVAGPRFSPDARPVESIPIVSSASMAGDVEIDIGAGVTGLAVDDQGVLVEYGNGTHLFRPRAATSAAADSESVPGLERVSGYTFRGQVYTAHPANPTADPAAEEAMTAHVMVGDQRIPVEGAQQVLGLRMLGINADGSFYVVAEEVSDGPTIQVDQTVRHYAADGRQLGLARVPLRDRETYIPHGLAVGPDGNVYLLMTRQDVLEVQRLVFTTSTLPPLPQVGSTEGESGAQQTGPTEMTDDPTADQDFLAAEGCRSRDAMITTGFKYRDNKVTLRDVNLNGNCPGRHRPTYLNGGPKEYGSVAYDWGGFDTVEGYNAAMAQGFQAGDIPVTRGDPPTPCSKGVDCSGFVSRCWGLQTKEGTATIGRLCIRINRDQLKPGDILNLENAHVTLFDHIGPEGVWAFEATTWGNRDRVIWRPHGWDYYDGYQALRFKNVCPD
jgi:hypothetical protein